ncbi:OmpA family protein [Empedobacter stercoris]|uniref:OmpA family protein n=1 Tax=Empedobacter stercoris TaxID=1628248 RepID=UPI00166287A8|nr:OmpA family protein [Empedobacter stercoris]MCA4810585.1 OmpA family protein [Empedobacter stercoris]QNT14195.1 OmpA family protein [Empedobacter stercoris]
MNKLFIVAIAATLIVSCNNKTEEKKTNNVAVDTNQNQENTIADKGFDINKIPFSTADIGDFPFINLPQGLQEMNKPLVKEFDICFFPINGVMTPFEGKLYKTFVSPKQGEEFSQHFFEKSMADYLQSIGAVKVFDGEITKEEYERYNKQDPNKGGEGDMGYAGQNMKFWVLRTKDKGNVYIQYLSNNAGASLNVLQEANFKQTITKVTADDIANDLTKNGKSILYINFDVDQAKITQEGDEIVTEIANALKKDNTMKISIEGHTDNSGDAKHNKKLSNDRANTVMQKLIALGIDKTRLSAIGYGAEKPFVANDTEENKAKNRRVELVKVK